MEASTNQGDVIGTPPHYARGTPRVALGKQKKLAAWLATAKWDSAAANARVASLWADRGRPDGTLPAQDALPPNGPEDPIDGMSKNPIWESPSSRRSEDSSDGTGASSATPATPSSTPKSRVSLSSLGAQMISDIASVRQDSRQARDPAPVLDGTPSLLTYGSVSATTTSSFSGRSSLNASKYPLVLHGQLPVNKCRDEHQADMFSMDHWIDLGAKGNFWYLFVGIDYIEDKDSKGTMLLGMSSILKMFPHMISGFELHLLNPYSTLPFPTSNNVKRGFPQSALLMFKYFHIKNTINLRGAPQTPTVAATVSLTRFDDEAEYTPSNTLWGTIKVWADENVKEAVEALTWDFNKTGIQVCWKPHQSADSSAQVQIMCCPNVFDKEGLTKELLFHMKAVEKKLMAKGWLSYTLMDEPLPPISIQRRQSTHGKGWNKREKQLSLNNLPAFGLIGCLVLTVKMEEGTWARLGPLWRALNSMGLVHQIFGQTAVLVVLYGGKPTESDQNTLQRLHWCHVIYVNNIATEVLPYVEMLHKRVEVQMEDSLEAPPHKFTDLCREVLEIVAVLPPDDPWYGTKGGVCL
jgi:hypothetical protein